jgi:hypothetical protein
MGLSQLLDLLFCFVRLCLFDDNNLISVQTITFVLHRACYIIPDWVKRIFATTSSLIIPFTERSVVPLSQYWQLYKSSWLAYLLFDPQYYHVFNKRPYSVGFTCSLCFQWEPGGQLHDRWVTFGLEQSYDLITVSYLMDSRVLCMQSLRW